MKTLKKQYWIVCLFLLAVCFLGFMVMPIVLAESNVAYSQTAPLEINDDEIYQIQPGKFGEYADKQCGKGNVDIRNYESILMGKNEYKEDDDIMNCTQKVRHFWRCLSLKIERGGFYSVALNVQIYNKK